MSFDIKHSFMVMFCNGWDPHRCHKKAIWRSFCQSMHELIRVLYTLWVFAMHELIGPLYSMRFCNCWLNLIMSDIRCGFGFIVVLIKSSNTLFVYVMKVSGAASTSDFFFWGYCRSKSVHQKSLAQWVRLRCLH